MLTKISQVLLLAGGLLLAVACTQQREAYSADFVQITNSQLTPIGRAPDLAAATTLIISRTNAFRQAQEREPVTVDPILTETAQDFASYMARTNRYGHTADGNQPAERAKQHGYDYCIVAENIAYQYNSAGFTTAELGSGFFTGWRQSPGHRRNMLEPAVTETGVAIVQSEESGYYYAVQLFGRPRSLMDEFAITNATETTVRYHIGDETFSLPPRYQRTHQRCEPTTVTFQWPDEQANSTIRPTDGDQYTVVQEASGEFALEEE